MAKMDGFDTTQNPNSIFAQNLNLMLKRVPRNGFIHKS